MTPRRIHITGGSGSGKTILASRVAALLDLPAEHLDDIARVGGGNGPVRPLDERLAAVGRIIERPAWVTEGVHLGWTDELLWSADAIVWLDYVSDRTAAWRIVLRFARNAWGEMRRRRGRQRFMRFGDYARNLRELVRAVPEARGYYGDRSRPLGSEAPLTRSATQRKLEPHAKKVIHCRTRPDADRFLATVARSVGVGGQ